MKEELKGVFVLGVFCWLLSRFFNAIKIGNLKIAGCLVIPLIISFISIFALIRIYYDNNRKLQKYIHLRKIRKYKERKK